MWHARYRRLREIGVLGINERNFAYIARYNQRQYYPLVDNKLLTKEAATKANIAVPALLGVIRTPSQMHLLPDLLNPLSQFVIKPARGSGGKGITVVGGREGSHFLKPSGATITMEQIRRHVSNILSGVYSLGGKPDVAFVEARVQGEPVLSKYTCEGLPDIRVIVFRGFPVMAMMRCPTHASDGKANLHQGAVGVGLNICSGRALRAVQRNHPVDRHPNTDVSFADLAIPGWRSLLELAASCYEMTRLGYLGCDIVLDRERGPLILELNARPGLAIQIANGIGLRHRLKAIEAQNPGEWRVAERVACVYRLFGDKVVDLTRSVAPTPAYKD